MTPVDHRNVSGNERPHRHAVGKHDCVGEEVAIFGFVAYKGGAPPQLSERGGVILTVQAPALPCNASTMFCYPNADPV